MSRADKSTREFRQSNVSKLLDRLKEREPQLFPLGKIKFTHQSFCDAALWYGACNCDCTLHLLTERRTFTHSSISKISL